MADCGITLIVEADGEMTTEVTSCALAHDILEWHVPDEAFSVLLKDRSTGDSRHFGTYCRVMDWNTGEPVEFRAITENGGGHG